ncbi:MAG TPA: peptidyl-dipeptidase Dcp [Rhodanobacteraceae bacterium]|nr:peptidyl-dipeptidase Dcp [Rhodanobacteraceae bacterium]
MLRTRTLAVMIAASFAMVACSSQSPDQQAPAAQASAAATATSTAAVADINPFFTKSTLPFQAPPFDKIQDSDYQPAIEKGMAERLAEVRKIADNPNPPTFENTYVALEKTGALLDRVLHAFSDVTSANTDDALQKVQKEMAPKLAANDDAVYLNDKLFQRLKAVYEKRDQLNLDPESLRLVNVVYNNFVRHGANLSKADKAKLKQLNQQAASLSTAFVSKLLAATKAGALVVDNKAALDGLSDAQIAAAAQAAKDRGLSDKWVIPLQNTTQQPLLAQLADRATRKALYEASWTRAEKGDANDTRDTIKQLAKVRAETAKLLGFPNWAAWKLTNQMAKTPGNVEDFLGKLAPAAVDQAKREAADIQAQIDKSGKHFKLKPWDWEYYAQKVKKAKYGINQDEIKPYFELDNVLKNGVFYAANQLYGLTFKERHDIPVYQKDVRVFEVFDADGKPMGLFYCDYFKRDNKQGGAWMDNLVTQSKLLGQKPVIYNVANFPKPAPGRPALLTWDDVITMFHEFGHALHGFFADQQYPTLSGTNTARDFVEFPSQFNEYWASNPKVFAHYAKNYKTGKPMPEELVKKMRKAGLFNAGYGMTELVEAADLDMNWHTLGVDAIPTSVDEFEASSLKKDGFPPDLVPPRYRSSYFMHIWGNGYSAGYYAYLWTQMLADNAHQWFLDHGGLTRANGDRFRKMVLSRGNTEDLAKLYKAWLGHDPKIGPMLKYRGLEQK